MWVLQSGHSSVFEMGIQGLSSAFCSFARDDGAGPIIAGANRKALSFFVGLGRRKSTRQNLGTCNFEQRIARSISTGCSFRADHCSCPLGECSIRCSCTQSPPRITLFMCFAFGRCGQEAFSRLSVESLFGFEVRVDCARYFEIDCFRQFVNGGFTDGLYSFEMRQQFVACFGANALDVIQF